MADALDIRGLSRMAFDTASAATNHTVDASNEGLAWAFQARAASPISKIWFRYGSRTGTPPTYRVSLQSLGTTGLPDGTVLGGGSPASATFTPPADTSWDGLGQWITLDNTYTPAEGEVLCVVVEYSSGTIDGSNNSSFTRSVSNLIGTSIQFPYSMTNTGGTWSKFSGSAAPCFAIEDAVGIYGVPFVSLYVSNTITSGHRVAAAMTLPSVFGSTFVVKSIVVGAVRIGSAGGTAKICIWDNAGTELASSGTIDTDQMASPANQGVYTAKLTSDVPLNYGTKYYYGIESTGTPVNLCGINLTNSADRAAYPIGQNRAWALWDGSSWAETTTRLPFVDLVFDDISVPSGGGGMVFVGARGPILSSGVVVH